MTVTSLRTGLVVLALTALILANGCDGGGGDGTATLPTSTPVTEPAPRATAPDSVGVTPSVVTTQPAIPSSPPPAPATAPASIAPAPASTLPSSALPAAFASIPVPAGSEYCDWARHADALFKRWMELPRGPDDNEAYVASLQPAWEQMRLNAPEELVAHFPVVTQMYEYVWQTLAESGYDVDVQQTEFGDEIMGRRDQAFLASAQAIETYGYDVCGITPP